MRKVNRKITPFKVVENRNRKRIKKHKKDPLAFHGMAFVEISGEITEMLLKKDQVLRVDTGHVAMFEPTVDFDIEVVKGVKNIFLGGEGLFFALLKGPGKVWLQSMPLANLAGKIGQYLTTGKHSGGSRRGIGGIIESFGRGI